MSENGGFDARRYWEGRLGAAYSLNGVGTIGLSAAYLTWMYRVRGAVFTRTVRPLARPGARVLDVGSGTGFYVECWRRLGVRSLTGSDMTAEAVGRLSARYPGIPFERWGAGAEGNPFGGRFDVISAMDVLFHIVDDDAYRRAVRDLARLLTPGGTLVLSENFLHGGEVRSAHHVSRALPDVLAAIEAGGLRVVERRPMFVLMNEPVDGNGPVLRAWWSLVRRAARDEGRCSQLLGAGTYPLERLLVRVVREGPSTEIALCRPRA
jgi:SAM-dependent methyltransferase